MPVNGHLHTARSCIDVLRERVAEQRNIFVLTMKAMAKLEAERVGRLEARIQELEREAENDFKARIQELERK
jgi:hypothetical protein